MSKMASNFGKFFSGISKSKKKAPKSKNKDDDSDDDSYEDPTNSFPTEAPSICVPPGMPAMSPSYHPPPPRYNSIGSEPGKVRMFSSVFCFLFFTFLSKGLLGIEKR